MNLFIAYRYTRDAVIKRSPFLRSNILQTFWKKALDCEIMADRANCINDRRRLRPWLERLLNNNEIPGLCWIDDGKQRTKFRIPWPHSGRKGWQPAESKVFMGWAQQNGRYREGIDKPDYVKWKTQLRCALNKAQDIEYLASESLENKDDSNSFRIYVFKNSSAEPKERRHDAPSAAHNGTSFSAGSQQIFHNIPGFVGQMRDDDDDVRSFPSDLENLPSSDLLRQNADMQMGTFSDMISAFIGGEDVKNAFNSGTNELAQVACEGGVRSTACYQPAPTALSPAAGVNDVTELADSIRMMSVEEGCDTFGLPQYNQAVTAEDTVDGSMSPWPPSANDVTTQGNSLDHVSCFDLAQYPAMDESCRHPAVSFDDDLALLLAHLEHDQRGNIWTTSSCYPSSSPEEVPPGSARYRRGSQHLQQQQLRQQEDQFAHYHNDNTASLFSCPGIQFAQQNYRYV